MTFEDLPTPNLRLIRSFLRKYTPGHAALPFLCRRMRFEALLPVELRITALPTTPTAEIPTDRWHGIRTLCFLIDQTIVQLAHFRAFLVALGTACPLVRHLSLVELDDSEVVQLAVRQWGSTLTGIDVECTDQSSAQEATQISEALAPVAHQLTHLSMSNVPRGSPTLPPGLSASNLQHLSLKWCSVSDGELLLLAQRGLPQLTYLTVYSFPEVTPAAMLGVVRASPNLRHLDTVEECLFEVLLAAPQLEELCILGKQPHMASNCAADWRFERLQRLEVKDLDGAGFAGLVRHCPALTDLNFRSGKLTDSDVIPPLEAHQFQAGEGAVAFPSLRSLWLDLPKEEGVSGTGLAAILRHTPALTELNLSHYRGLLALAPPLPRLRELSMHVGSTPLTLLGRICPNLRELRAYCWDGSTTDLIGDTDIEALAEGCPLLRCIYISNTQITDRALTALATRLTDLQRLEVASQSLTEAGIAALQTAFPGIHCNCRIGTAA